MGVEVPELLPREGVGGEEGEEVGEGVTEADCEGLPELEDVWVREVDTEVVAEGYGEAEEEVDTVQVVLSEAVDHTEIVELTAWVTVLTTEIVGKEVFVWDDVTVGVELTLWDTVPRELKLGVLVSL